MPDIFLDHILEVYAPAEGDDHERAHEGIQALIKANAEGQNVIEGHRELRLHPGL